MRRFLEFVDLITDDIETGEQNCGGGILEQYANDTYEMSFVIH